MNKRLTFCYAYFLVVPILLILSLANYMMTHNTDGFDRLQSLNLDIQKFYCYKEIHQMERCQKVVDENEYMQ